MELRLGVFATKGQKKTHQRLQCHLQGWQRCGVGFHIICLSMKGHKHGSANTFFRDCHAYLDYTVTM